MIHVFYTAFTHKLAPDRFTYWFNQLTPAMQNQVSRFRHWQDAQRTLLGKALLLTASQTIYNLQVSLNNLDYTSFQKPHFKKGPFFNISHSGNLVVCAISMNHNMGIDVEEALPVPLSDFHDLFSEAELQKIFANPTDYLPFYRLWTQKEACLKAIGTGLNVPLRQLIVQNSHIIYDGNTWYLHELALQPGYVCHLASPALNPQIILKELSFHSY